MSSFLSNVAQKAICMLLKKKLHDDHPELSEFEFFLQHYHYFVRHLRKGVQRYIGDAEDLALLHLKPLEADMMNEMTIFLEAAPIRSAGLFTTRFVHQLQHNDQVKKMAARLVTEWATSGKMDWVECEHLAWVIAKVFIEDEEAEVITKLRAFLRKFMQQAADNKKKQVFVYKLIRYVDLFLKIIPVNDKKLLPIEQQLAQDVEQVIQPTTTTTTTTAAEPPTSQ